MPQTIHRKSLTGAVIALSLLGWGALGIVHSQNTPNFEPFREYFYQPRYSITEEILERHDSLLKVILSERSALLWGEESAEYTPLLLGMRMNGLYASDSNFIQRRACWLSSLFARDVDFIEVSAYSVDGHVSLREMYAINREDKRWAVVDSAGFPLFERVIAISSQDTTGRDDLRDFLLTLLSYAGYGSYNMLGTVDSIYHGIELADALEDRYYPFKVTRRADTTVVRFTSCLRDGVEVSRWGFLLTDDGVIIEESEQLVTFEDLPEKVDTSQTAQAGREDTSALGALLTDVATDTAGDTVKGATGDTTADTAGAAYVETHPDAPGGVRLADLLAGRVKPTQNPGTITYEILSFKPVLPVDSSAELSGPEFVNFVQPQYPPLAYQQKQEDSVELMVRVDSLGKARQSMVVARPEHRGVGFDINAKLAATKCVFRPGTVNGKAVDMWLTYRITYRLGGKTGAATDPSAGSSETPDSLALDTMPLSRPFDTTVTDKEPPDTSNADTAQTDSVVADSSVTDSPVVDTTTTDSAGADTMTADTAVIDSTPADSSTQDSAG